MRICAFSLVFLSAVSGFVALIQFGEGETLLGFSLLGGTVSLAISSAVLLCLDDIRSELRHIRKVTEKH